jgi:SAM-dependent methyltransferase
VECSECCGSDQLSVCLNNVKLGDRVTEAAYESVLANRHSGLNHTEVINLLTILRKVARRIWRVLPKWKRSKHATELAYWKKARAKEGVLENEHYEQFYTTHFGLGKESYVGKRVLDIGCGPRGSLEWADGTLDRVGLDPLADQYLKLGGDKQKMRYVPTGVENAPFEDGYFDVVCSFNSLDHVDDLDKAISEIKRLIAPGGMFLLLTEVDHDPTPCEPIEFSFDIVDKFKPELTLVEERHYEKTHPTGMYQSILMPKVYDHSNKQRRYGIVSAKFEKRS